jgi:glycosyltransferase involved in cell wall biosynthesis
MSKKDVDIEFILPYEADHGVDFMKITAASPQDGESFILNNSVYDSKYFSLNAGYSFYNIHDQQMIYEHSVTKLVENQEYDVVHAHDWLTFRAALKLKHLKKWPIILHVHSIESDRAGSTHGNPLVEEIESIALMSADKVIAVSEHTKQAIIHAYSIPADKIEVVHNSIDTSMLEPLDGDNAYHYLSAMKSLGYRVVVNVGRLTIQKGLPNLLKAARKVLVHNPKTIFLIVGSGEQSHELISLAGELGIGANVLFADFQRGKNWRDAYAIGDLFVMPSISEPFGLTPLEAVAYGTPSLVSKQSGISEVLRNCLKVDFWDVDEMANKIDGVMNNDSLRDELLTNATKELSSLSWDKASDKIIQLYKQHTDPIGATA